MAITLQIGSPFQTTAICPLIHEASILTRFLFIDLQTGKLDDHSLIQEIRGTKSKYSHKNCLVALENGRVVGVANNFPSEQLALTPEMRARFGAEKIDYIAPFIQILCPKASTSALYRLIPYNG